MENIKNWEELKLDIADVMQQIKSDNYEELEELYKNIKLHFDKSDYTKNELLELRGLIKDIENQINLKIDDYYSKLHDTENVKKGFMQYLNNINLPID